MKITSLFSADTLKSEDLISKLSSLQNITLKANGQSVAGTSFSEIEQLVLDFIDVHNGNLWLELDFLNQELFYPRAVDCKLRLVATFYPNQDKTYKDSSPRIIEIMKIVYTIINPVLVFADSNDASNNLCAGSTSKIDTSFIVFNIELLEDDKKTLIENPDLFHAEMLSDRIVWINGPLGLGDETFHIHGEIFDTLSKKSIEIIQNQREKHQIALSLIVASLDTHRYSQDSP